MKKGILVIALLILLPFVNASIAISSPEPVYNNGDLMELSVTLKNPSAINDFLSGAIECSDSSFEVYHSVVSLNSDESKDVSLSVPIDPFLLGNLSGVCDFKVSYNGEERMSQSFEITNKVNVNLMRNHSEYNPGESIPFSGTAIKKNGESLNGTVELYIKDGDLRFDSSVTGGDFKLNLELPENIPSRTYTIVAWAYEENANGEILNEGFGEQQIKVNQIVKSIEFAFNSLNFSLNDEIVFTPVVYDQAGEKAVRKAEVELLNSSGYRLAVIDSNSDVSSKVIVNQSFSPGEYTLETNVDGISGTGSFFVEEVRGLSYNVVNQSLLVTNTGNVIYEDLLDIFIGDTKQQIPIKLEVGESREYILKAPKGYYPIAVDESGEISAIGTTFLTGSAISITEYGAMIRGRFYSIVIWFIVIVAALSAGIYYYRRIRKSPYTAKTPFNIVNSVRGSIPVKMQKSEGIIQEGEKREGSIVVLKIKNMDEIKSSASNAVESIESAVTGLKLLNARVQEDNGVWTAVFLPKMTGENDNNLRAVKAAQKVEKDLVEHNRKYSQKIKFGIGVHFGEVIVEISGGKNRFTSSGNTLLQARRIADKANGTTLISEDVRNKTLSHVKVEKTEDGAYKITRIVERTNTQFMERFKQKKLES